MSLINQYRSTEEQIKALQDQLESLKSNEDLQKEIEFETELKSLMTEYQKSLRDVIAIIDPTISTGQVKISGSPKVTRKPRQIKVYKNPHTGEVIETKGGNHKGLKAWKEQYGVDEVASWLN